MTAHEMAGVCIAAAVGLLFVAPAAFDRWHKPRSIRRFQRTAAEAAAPRPEDEVRRELAATKVQLTDIEQRIFAQIAAELRKTLPNQRQPRKDQP